MTTAEGTEATQAAAPSTKNAKRAKRSKVARKAKPHIKAKQPRARSPRGETREKVRRMMVAAIPVTEMAKRLKITTTSVYNHIQNLRAAKANNGKPSGSVQRRVNVVHRKGSSGFDKELQELAVAFARPIIESEYQQRVRSALTRN